MVFVYALDKGNKKWVMKIERNKFIKIRKTVEYFWTDTATKLLQIHAVAGRYKTCLYMVLGKLMFKLVATLEKKKRVLMKQGYACLNKWKQQLLSLYLQSKCQCCKLLSVFTIKFIAGQE